MSSNPKARKGVANSAGAAGLVISFSVFIILMAQVWYDVTFDRTLPSAGRVYVFEYPQSRTAEQSPFQYLMNRPQIRAISEASPAVEAVGTMAESIMLDPRTEEPVASAGAVLVDMDFTRIFPFRMITGTADGFDRPDAVILTEKTASRYFGGPSDAVGKPVVIGRDAMSQATVIGVCKDFPANGSFANIGLFGQIGDLSIEANGPNYESFSSYVLLEKGASPKDVAPVMAEAFVRNWVLHEDSGTVPDIRARARSESRLVSLHSTHYDPYLGGNGSRARDTVLCMIAFLFLLVGLLNVFNLSMAGLPFRIKDGCIRMVFGAGKEVLFRRDIVNAVCLCFVSFALALMVMQLVAASPLASMLSVPLRIKTLLPVLAACLAVALAGSVLAVYIPSRYAFSFTPAEVLKGNISLSGRGKGFREGTLAFQYLLSFIFITVGLMIGVQNRYVSDFDLGFRTDDIVYAYMGYFSSGKHEAVREELLKDPDISEVAFSNVPLLLENPRIQTRNAGGVTTRFAGLDVSSDFLDFFGFEIVEGRGFTHEDGLRPTGSFIVNEAFLRAYPELGIGSAMNGIRQGRPDTEAEIIGVVKDFHYQGLTHPVEPYAIYCSGEAGAPTNDIPRYFRIAVKTVEGRAGAVAGKLPGLLNKFSDGENDARCEVLKDTAKAMYSGNARESSLVRTSSVLSLVLALLGIKEFLCLFDKINDVVIHMFFSFPV